MEPSEQDIARAVAEATEQPGQVVEVAATGQDVTRCWSCDHDIDDHNDDGCTYLIRCSLVTVEQANDPTFCPCASTGGAE